jgi:hypothetical protein
MKKNLLLITSMLVSFNVFASFGEVSCPEEKAALKASEEKCAGLTDKKEKKACKKEVKKAKKAVKTCEKKAKAEAKKMAKKIAVKVEASEKNEAPGEALCKRLGALYDATKKDCKINPDCENTEDAMTFVEVSLLERKCFVANDERKKCEAAKKKWNEDSGKCQ